MALTSVELAGMTAAQNSFQSALDETTGAYTQMGGQIEGLQGSWTGEAAQVYTQAMHEWLNDFHQVNQALRTMLEKLASNTKVYANAHESTQQVARQVAQTVGSGASGLPGFPS